MSKKILIIEDNTDVRENISEIIELANYNVVSAENGRRGIEKAREEKPDLILCDIMMPELDGYGVIHVLSKDPATAHIPFIFLTAKADKVDIRKGLGLGADDYITKPFDETDLLETIENRLKKYERIRATFQKVEEDPKGNIFEASLNNSSLEDLIVNKKERFLGKKEVLFREGDFANYVYYILKGKIKCSKVDDYGKELITEVLTEGSYLGYVDILKESEFSETATAVEDSTIIYIPKSDFLDLVLNDKDIAVHFIKLLSNNVTEKEKELLRLAFSPVRERSAWALVKLFKDSQNNEEIINSLSREDLASVVGTSTESLIRMLSEFKKEGLIEIKNKEIKILKLEDLVRLSDI